MVWLVGMDGESLSAYDALIRASSVPLCRAMGIYFYFSVLGGVVFVVRLLGRSTMSLAVGGSNPV